MNLHVPSMPEAVKEAYEKLMPSKMLFSIKDPDRVVPELKHEQVLGLFAANERPAKQVHRFATEQQAVFDKIHADYKSRGFLDKYFGRGNIDALKGRLAHVDQGRSLLWRTIADKATGETGRRTLVGSEAWKALIPQAVGGYVRPESGRPMAKAFAKAMGKGGAKYGLSAGLLSIPLLAALRNTDADRRRRASRLSVDHPFASAVMPRHLVRPMLDRK